MEDKKAAKKLCAKKHPDWILTKKMLAKKKSLNVQKLKQLFDPDWYRVLEK